MSNNGIISPAQIKKLLILDIISVSIIILPGLAAGGAGRDGLIAIALGSLAALAYSLFLLCASDGGLSTGKLAAFIFGTFYIVKIIFSCLFSLTLFSKVITDTLLPDTNAKAVVFTLIAVSLYIAAGGIEVRARVAEILFYIILVPLTALFILGFKNIEPAKLFPLLTSGNEVFYTGYSVLLTYSAVEFLMFTASPSREHKRELYKAVTKSVFVATVINLMLFILVLGLLGLAGAGRQFKASIMIMQLIQIPGGLVQRQDAIMLTIWMLSIFTILSAYFYYLVKITGAFVKAKACPLFIFYGALLFSLSLIKIPIETLFDYYGKYMAYIGFPQSIVIPLLMLLIRSRRGGSYGQAD